MMTPAIMPITGGDKYVNKLKFFFPPDIIRDPNPQSNGE